MVRRKSRAAALVAVFACLQTPAWAQEPTATPEPQPPLSEVPPTPLDGTDDNATEPPDGPQLPETGADALLVAMLGLGLVGTGTGLRITVSRTGG
jgi:hypothetical protein